MLVTSRAKVRNYLAGRDTGRWREGEQEIEAAPVRLVFEVHTVFEGEVMSTGSASPVDDRQGRPARDVCAKERDLL